MREYCTDLEEKMQQEMKQLSVRKKEQYVSETSRVLAWYRAVCCSVSEMCIPPPQGAFVNWLKVTFSEVFVAWIHLKALRVFVESALRSAPITLTIKIFLNFNFETKRHRINFPLTSWALLSGMACP